MGNLRFNRKKFFDGFREHIDSSIEQEQVDGLEFLLGQMETDRLWKDLRHIAYALATTGHETAWSFQPVEEGYYLPSAARVKAFQKSLRYYPYFGRGYVQLTWETRRIPNYSKASKALGVDFVTNPALVMVPENAYKILTLGMHQGWFTSKKLVDYISGSKCDYKNARKIINGLDKAALIAGYAVQFEKILKASATTPAVPTPRIMSEPADAQTSLRQTTPADTANDAPLPTESSPIVPVEQTAPSVTNTSVEQTVTESSGGEKEIVTTTVAESVESPVEVKKESPSWFVKIAAPFTALSGLGINAGSLIQSKIEELTPQQIGYMVAALGLVALGIWWWHKSAKAAQVRTMQLVEKAADRDAATVVLK